MLSLINNNKVATFLLVLVLVSFLTILAFSLVTHSNGFELSGVTTMRYCVFSDGVCTG